MQFAFRGDDADEGSSDEITRSIIRKSDKNKPHICAELFSDEVYFQGPTLLLGCTNEVLLEIAETDSTRGWLAKLKPFKLKGRATLHLCQLARCGAINVHEDMILRSQINTKLKGNLTQEQMPYVCDYARPQGPDLMKVLPFVRLCRDRVQNLKKQRVAIKECIAELLGMYIADVLKSGNGVEAELAFAPGVEFGSKVEVKAMENLVANYEFNEKMLQDNPDGFDGDDIFKMWFLYSDMSELDIFTLPIEYFLLQALKGQFPLQDGWEFDPMDAVASGEDPDDEDCDRRSSASSSSCSSSTGDNIYAPRPPGRRAHSLFSHIAKLGMPHIQDQVLHISRVHFCYAHLQFIQMLKMLTAGKPMHMGFATDDTAVSGSDTASLRVRGKFLRPPFTRTTITTTVALPPVKFRRVNDRKIKSVIQNCKRFKIDKDAKTEFEGSMGQSELLWILQQKTSFYRLGTEIHVIICVDEGPKQRKVWLFLMASGLMFAVFFDEPHLQHAAATHTAAQLCPPEVKLLTKIKSCAKGVHAVKIANVLQYCSEEVDIENLMDLIAEHRDNLKIELGTCSVNPRDLAYPFQLACYELQRQLKEVSNYKWRKELYTFVVLDRKWTVLLVVCEYVYAGEFKNVDRALQARIKKKFEDGRWHFSYDPDDLKALEEMLTPHQMGYMEDMRQDLEDVESSDSEVEEDVGDQHGVRVPKPKKTEAAQSAAAPAPPAGGTAAAAQNQAKANDEQKKAESNAINSMKKAGAGNASTDEIAELLNTIGQTSSIYKKMSDRFIEHLCMFLRDPFVRAQCFIYKLCGMPVVFAHGMLISCVHTNINARQMMYRLPAITLAEVAENHRHPLPDSYRRIAADIERFPKMLGDATVCTMVEQLKVNLQQLCQYQRLFLYAKSDELDANLKEVTHGQQNKLNKNANWLLLHPTLRTHDPRRFGMGEDGGKMEQVYEDELEAPLSGLNDVSLFVEKKNGPSPSSMNFLPEMTPLEWETEVWEACYLAQESTDYAPAQWLCRFLLNEPKYWVVQTFIARLRLQEAHEVRAWITEMQDARINSTRDIEARGSDLHSSAKKCHDTGCMTDATAYYTAQRTVPEWVTMLSVDRATQEMGYTQEMMDDPAKLSKDRPPKVIGVMNSFSELDGRKKWTGSTNDNNFWEQTTMEDAFGGLRDVNELDDWCRKKLRELQKLPLSNRAMLEEFKKEAFERAREEFETKKAPPIEIMKAQCKKYLNNQEPASFLTHQQMTELAETKFNIDSLWKMVIAELLIWEYRHAVATQDAEFEKETQIGRLFTVLHKGIFDRFKLLKKPYVLRVVNHVGHIFYLIAMDVVVDMNVCITITLDAVKHYGDGEVAYQHPLRMKKVKRDKPVDATEKTARIERLLPSESDGEDAGDWQEVAVEDVTKPKRLTPFGPEYMKAWEKENDEIYFTFPEGAESYSLPIQCGAGSTDRSKIAFFFNKSSTMAAYTDKGYSRELDVCEADWCYNESSDFVFIKVKTAPSSRRSVLDQAIKYGFGMTDNWLKAASQEVAASSSCADCKDIAKQLITESPPILHRLNNENTPPGWSLANDCRRLQKFFQEWEDKQLGEIFAGVSPKVGGSLAADAVAASLDPCTGLPAELEKAKEMEKPAESWPVSHAFESNQVSFSEMVMPKNFRNMAMRDSAELEMPEWGYGTRYEDVYDLGGQLWGSAAEHFDGNGLMEPPAGLVAARDEFEKLEADKQSPEEIDPSEPLAFEDDPPELKRVIHHQRNFVSCFRANFMEAPQWQMPLVEDKVPTPREASPSKGAEDDPMEVDAAEDAAPAENLQNGNSLAQEDDNTFLNMPAARVDWGDPSVEPSLKVGKKDEKQGDALDELPARAEQVPADNTALNIDRMSSVVTDLKLKAREWTQIMYVLYFGGRKEAKKFLFKHGFYDVTDEAGKVRAGNCSLQLCCEGFLIKLQNEVHKKKAMAYKEQQAIRVGAKKQGAKAAPKRKYKKATELELSQNIEDLAADGVDVDELAGPAQKKQKKGAFDGFESDGDHARLELGGVDENPHLPAPPLNLQFEEKRASEQTKELEAHYKGTAQGQAECQKILHQFPDAVDLVCETVKESDGRTRRIMCTNCGKHLFDCSRRYLGSNAPQLVCTTQDGQATVRRRQLGPRCHLKKKATLGGTRCFCGYWHGGKLYRDEGCTILETDLDCYWRCAETYMELKARYNSWVCECWTHDWDPTAAKYTLKQSDTFDRTEKQA